VYLREPDQSIQQQLAQFQMEQPQGVWLIDQQGTLYSETLCFPATSFSHDPLSGSLERQTQIGLLARKRVDLSERIEQVDKELSHINQKVDISIDPSTTYQTIEGFGGCFN